MLVLARILWIPCNRLLGRRDAGASAPVSAHSQRGESPLQARPLRPVTECNCVVEGSQEAAEGRVESNRR